MTPLFNSSCPIEPLPDLAESGVTVSVLRLDLLHAIVSGNKWFKLKYYLSEAMAGGRSILTFGGAYSNHIVATAAAAKEAGIPCIGIIRGEEGLTPSPTILQAKALGMDLFFISRKDYAEKLIPEAIRKKEQDLYVIPEGGYGYLGMLGAKDILLQNKTETFTHILTAVGTGTTLAGLIAGAMNDQQVIGVSVLKNNFSLQNEVEQLLPVEKRPPFTLFHDYHFGGYAKKSAELIQFMNDFYRQTGIATDFVYTGKAFFAAIDLVRSHHVPPGSNLLVIHTGGLQGNRSLPKGTLIFG